MSNKIKNDVYNKIKALDYIYLEARRKSSTKAKFDREFHIS